MRGSVNHTKEDADRLLGILAEGPANGEISGQLRKLALMYINGDASFVELMNQGVWDGVNKDTLQQAVKEAAAEQGAENWPLSVESMAEAEFMESGKEADKEADEELKGYVERERNPEDRDALRSEIAQKVAADGGTEDDINSELYAAGFNDDEIEDAINNHSRGGGKEARNETDDEDRENEDDDMETSDTDPAEEKLETLNEAKEAVKELAEGKAELAAEAGDEEAVKEAASSGKKALKGKAATAAKIAGGAIAGNALANMEKYTGGDKDPTITASAAAKPADIKSGSNSAQLVHDTAETFNKSLEKQKQAAENKPVENKSRPVTNLGNWGDRR